MKKAMPWRLIFPNQFNFQIGLVFVVTQRESHSGIDAQTVEQFELAQEVDSRSNTTEPGNGKGTQHIVLVHGDPAVVVVTVEQGIAESKTVGLVWRLVGDIVAKQIAPAVGLVVVEIMAKGSLVAENQIVGNVVADLEIDRAFGVEDGVVAENQCVRGVLHLGLCLET